MAVVLLIKQLRPLQKRRNPNLLRNLKNPRNPILNFCPLTMVSSFFLLQ
jgi:hypothetical protein